MSETLPYSPPPEMVAAAEAKLAAATPAALAKAEAAYQAYGDVTGGRSAVTGAQLPAFADCKPLVRAGWLAATTSPSIPRPPQPGPDYVWDAFAHRWYQPGAKGPAIGHSAVGA